MRSHYTVDCWLQQTQGEDKRIEGSCAGTTKAATQSNADMRALFLMECCCQGISRDTGKESEGHHSRMEKADQIV